MVNLKGSKIYNPLKYAFFTISYYILKTFGIKNRKYYLSKWVADDSDNTLLTKYPLNSDSLVIDVGGYTGYFSDKINSLYNPHLLIFEPVKKYFKFLDKKYKNHKNIKVLNYGLSNKTIYKKIYLSNDGTSLFKKSNKTEKIHLKKASDIIKQYKSIDLISINIEGSEYDLLESLIQNSLLAKIKYLQVQFHHILPDSENRRRKIINKISKTHKKKFSYPFVWESFERKE